MSHNFNFIRNQHVVNELLKIMGIWNKNDYYIVRFEPNSDSISAVNDRLKFLVYPNNMCS